MDADTTIRCCICGRKTRAEWVYFPDEHPRYGKQYFTEDDFIGRSCMLRLIEQGVSKERFENQMEEKR